jgi:hypothetical protein
MNNYLTLVLILLTHLSFCQTLKEKELHGKINVDSNSAEGINIVNSSNQKANISDKNGFFTLAVNEGDILIFSAVNLETLRKIISEQDFVSEVISIKMNSKSNELKEVIINAYPDINAVSLGISPPGMKSYTPAQRKLYTANSGGGIDGLLNKISGRTAMLKKELIVENKEKMLARIEFLFEDKYYIETLKIPQDYIKGFQYYCVENDDFNASLQSKNKTLTLFLIVPLAQKFNQFIQNEK